MPRSRPPIVTLITDFGTRDSYVAEMEAAIACEAPAARIIHVTHEIPPQDVLAGSITLERILRACDRETIHVAVVDPGVGTDRKLLLARLRDQWIICPDNGLITWPLRRHPGGTVVELTWRPRSTSTTFHGRDIMAPAAAWLATQRRKKLGGAPIVPILPDLYPAGEGHTPRVIHIDHFGNATTNVTAEWLVDIGATRVIHARQRLPIRKTYADVPPGESLALIGSSGLLELAVRNGSAAEQLKIKVATPIQLE